MLMCAPVATRMSVNTVFPRHAPRATPDATRGIVGPQSGADPEARLRRLLMMGVDERARAMQKATPTGAKRALPFSVGPQREGDVKCSLLVSDPSVNATLSAPFLKNF